MEHWVDGYNLILRKQWNVDRTLEQSREKLSSALKALGTPTRVYYDAARGFGPHSPSTGAETVRFVRDKTADEAIIDDLRSVPRGSVTVVTDDRELRGRARQVGANTCGVDAFLERLDRTQAPLGSGRITRQGRPAPGEKPERVSKKELDDWMNWFGFDRDPPEPLP